MMRGLIISLLLILSSISQAEDRLFENYMSARLAILAAEIEQLHTSMASLRGGRSVEPNFSAVDEVLRRYGYSHSVFYNFAERYRLGLADWLARHPAWLGQLETLTARQARLLEDYDDLRITTTLD